eukprot:CAMPEP_0201526642 /NCGR_PEP_ID=MMETSP0161_2-20130828/32441_1 /ASSEMBLY_ACC=CAM_ASM_000251 /TAXON_ID=180227 /ORGANISM="Neoparamoeba aestuarina, Strain SoJaBio B1-5/56/2" /LENGTH=89 /DNA_ID=CAMNT_0047927107 /DNA_START=310 /DNA_END=579 /DNA_ORIENTATION=+
MSTIENVEKKNPIRASAYSYAPETPKRRRGSGGDSSSDITSSTPSSESHAFDLGSQRNFEAVFGEGSWITWILPIWTTPGDGVHFETSV